MEKFCITVASLPDREHLVSEIMYEHRQWLEISEETEVFLVQFYWYPDQKYWEFSLDEALQIIEQAAQRLIDIPIADEYKHLFPKQTYQGFTGVFRINIADHPQNRHVVVEVFCDEIRWVKISEETENLMIRFYPHPTQDCWEIPYKKVMEVLLEAKKRLLEASEKKKTVIVQTSLLSRMYRRILKLWHEVCD